MLWYLIIMSTLTDEEKRELRTPKMKKQMWEWAKLWYGACILISLFTICILIIIFESW